MMKRLLLLALIGLCGMRGALTTDQPPTQFTLPLKIGAGGFITGLDINSDGTRLARTDTYGAYIWQTSASCQYGNGTILAPCWQQLSTQSRLPPANFGFTGTGTSQVNQALLGALGPGVYEICSAPSNSSIIYMMMNGFIFKSTNKGVSFSQTTGLNGTTAVPMAVNNPNIYRLNGRKMAVDPINPNIVYAGTDTLGMFVTTDGGMTWAGISSSSIPFSTVSGNSTPNYQIAFDPASSPIGGATSIIYVNYSLGGASTASATYASTDAGATWSPITATGPTTMERMVVSSTGVLWATDGVNNVGGFVWSYSGGGIAGTWTKFTTNGATSNNHTIAVDPANPARVVAGSIGGLLNVSSNSGANWGGAGTIARVATDVPWLQNENEISMSNGEMMFDPSLSNTLLFGEGIGVWATNPPASGLTTWTATAAGIEQLVSRVVIAPNGVAVTGTSDRANWYLNSPNTYPSFYAAPYYDSFSLNVAWALDYASTNTNFMVGVIGDINSTTNNNSGFSTDGGQTWKPFNSYYQDIAASGLANNGSGLIRVTVPTTTGLVSWTPGTTARNSIVRLINYGGAPNTARLYFEITVVDSTHIDLLNSTFTTALAAAGRYYVYADTNPLTDNNGLYTVTAAAVGGSGRVKITVNSTSSASLSNTLVCVTGVGGTTEANGCWTATTNGTNSFDLLGSTFVNAYTSGGSVVKTIPPGGFIAAASTQNIIMAGSNQDYPSCTTDGGLTWTVIKQPGGLGIGATTGWSPASFDNHRAAAADRDTANQPNVIYLFNVIGNTYIMYTITNCAVTTSFTGTIANALASPTVLTIPGYQQHILVAVGTQGSPGSLHPSGGTLRWSNNAGSSFTQITNTAEPRVIGVGAIAPGSDYPTVYMVGWVSNVYGIWRSTSTAAQWAANNVSWTKVGDYPLGSQDGPTAFSGDLTQWNRWYLGWNGSGFTYGQQN